MAQSTRSKMKMPNALFEFSLSEGEVRSWEGVKSPREGREGGRGRGREGEREGGEGHY